MLSASDYKWVFPDRAKGAIKRQPEAAHYPMIHRYSSRRCPLKDFLATQLQGARRYDRIAGFFSRLLLFDVNVNIKTILGEKEVTIKENDHVTSRNA